MFLRAPLIMAASPQCIQVLVVEDNEGALRLRNELLGAAAECIAVRHADSLRAALEIIRSAGAGLILCDMSLPDSSGANTVRRLHEAASAIPIIALTATHDEAAALAAFDAGARDCLAREEITGPLLVRAVRHAVKRAEADRELDEERNLLRSVIDNLPDRIFVKDTEGRYVLDNVAHRRSLGREKMHDVTGRTVFDFFPRSVAEKFTEDDEQVMRGGGPIINREEPASENHGTRKWLSTTKVPLRNRAGRVVGIVGIGRDITERKQAAEKLALYNQQIQERNAQFEEDLEMAGEMQQALLPQHVLTFPRSMPTDRRPLRFCSRYIPNGTVSGDFFQILPLSDSEVGLFIGDVMGHGVRAALVTAVQRALIEELVDSASDPGEFLTQMNKSLLSILRRTRTPLFASGFYLVASAQTGVVRFANAGHPKPFVLRRSAGTIETLCGDETRPGPALGLFREAAYQSREARLSADDTVLLFTDGLFEVENAAGDFLDHTRLREVVERFMPMRTEELLDAAVGHFRSFCAGSKFEDDVCLVGMDFVRNPGA
jgi:sigma-B regulation protein RsbU (phosphoserine phosphatase)